MCILKCFITPTQLIYLLSFSCCSYFPFFIITLILTYLNSEKDLVKQAKTLNSAANKLIQKHH